MSKPVAVPETKYPRHYSDSSDEDEDEDQDLISPPTLGSNDNFGPHLVKSLRASLGINEQDKIHPSSWRKQVHLVWTTWPL